MTSWPSAEATFGSEEGAVSERESALCAAPTTPPEKWRLRAVLELNRVRGASRRYSASITLRNRFAMLAAADELEAVTKEATTWLSSNPCPDHELLAHIEGMLGTSAEVAVTARQAVTDPAADIETTMGRIGNLLAQIEIDSHVLDSWLRRRGSRRRRRAAGTAAGVA